MKNQCKAMLAATVFVSMCAWATPPNSITVNEFGTNSTQYWSGTTSPLSWELGPDPTGGVTGQNVLIYNLPFAGVAGDVLMNDTTEPTNASWNMMFPDYNILDVIRFDGNGHLIFYSDGSVDGIEAPADTSVAPTLNALLFPQVIINEIGIEGDNSAFYYPTTGQPGSFASGYISYLFVSDVPEPGTLALAGSGLAALLFLKRLRLRK